MKQFIIRHETKEERRKVENLVRESFWNVYRPGCFEHFVLHCLRNDKAFILQLDFVMTLNDGHENVLMGQVMCMHAEIKTDDGTVLPIMTFGPICIRPDYQRPDTERLASFVVGRVGRTVSIEHGGRYSESNYGNNTYFGWRYSDLAVLCPLGYFSHILSDCFLCNPDNSWIVWILIFILILTHQAHQVLRLGALLLAKHNDIFCN